MVYPNHASNKATIEFNSTNASAYTLEVTDVAGKVLLRKKGRSSFASNITQIDECRFAQGMYFIGTIDEKDKQTIKLNKE
jgi:hypothetical protein